MALCLDSVDSFSTFANHFQMSSGKHKAQHKHLQTRTTYRKDTHMQLCEKKKPQQTFSDVYIWNEVFLQRQPASASSRGLRAVHVSEHEETRATHGSGAKSAVSEAK